MTKNQSKSSLKSLKARGVRATQGISSARGGSCIIATCDGHRGREATAELLNLLSQVR